MPWNHAFPLRKWSKLKTLVIPIFPPLWGLWGVVKPSYICNCWYISYKSAYTNQPIQWNGLWTLVVYKMMAKWTSMIFERPTLPANGFPKNPCWCTSFCGHANMRVDKNMPHIELGPTNRQLVGRHVAGYESLDEFLGCMRHHGKLLEFVLLPHQVNLEKSVKHP